MKVEHERNEAVAKETRLRKYMFFQLKNKDNMLSKEHTRTANVVARLDHSEV